MIGATLHQLGITLRLHFRNRMALLYSYLFPTIFLVAFWVLYRQETVPLVRHVGELLTVTALGGACFGLPTAMVSERERGVWRRFRLTPARSGALIGTTVVGRYLLLLTAGLLQVALAMGVFGMPAPAHPLDLLVAFTFVCFAFLGLGLVIAMLADNVPAVQALGQCIFLPMLIIGGVAVKIESLPAWAQQLSAYFPGRYAVAALQTATTGDGLGGARFALLALLLIGAAGCVAGAKLFRWDQQQRFARMEGKGWVTAALASWVFVGVLAGATGQVGIGVPSATGGATLRSTLATPEPGREATTPITPADTALRDTASAADTAALAPAPVPRDSVVPKDSAPPPPVARPAQPWQEVTPADVRRVDFASLPLDEGVVAPVGSEDEALLPETLSLLQCTRSAIGRWQAASVEDPVQRVRNVLYVAAVPDVLQMEELERSLPLVVYDHLRETTARGDLEKILFWIGSHPDDGDDAAADQLRAVCLDISGTDDRATLRERTRFYALKLLGRITGALPR